MFHLLAFGGAALDASAGDVQLPAVADQQYTRSNNNFQLPVSHQLYWGYSGGTGLTRARIQTGSLRSKGLPQIFPVFGATVPPSPHNVFDMRENPIMLRAEEDLRIDVTDAAANPVVTLLAVSPFTLNRNINTRDLRIIRFTATSVLAELAWAAPVSLTFQDTLEGGNYSVFGMYTQGANLIASRLIFPNNNALRPGSLGEAAVTNVINTEVAFGGMGKWGEFTTYAQPQLECLGNTAGSQAIEGRLLVGK